MPPKFEFFDYKGYRIPEHLIALTGAGSETLDLIGRAHIEHLEEFVGTDPGMTFEGIRLRHRARRIPSRRYSE